MRTLSILALLSGIAAADQPAPLRIGVFDQHATGGQGVSNTGLIRWLNENGYTAEPVTSLRPLALASLDLLYLSDMHSPGRVHDGWRDDIVAFVETGGSVLQTWHHHILGQVSVGVQRVYGSRGMHVVPGHPAVAGLSDFEADFKDHIYEKVGPLAVPLITNDDGEVVATAGAIGKGKVISTGLALALRGGRVGAAPRGAERDVLIAFLTWLRPDTPRGERLAAVFAEPRLEVASEYALVPAGRDARFRAMVGLPPGQEGTVTCDGATISIDEESGQQTDAGTLRVYDVRIPTDTAGESRHALSARIGGAEFSSELVVDAVGGRAPENEVRGVWLHVAENKHPSVVMPELKRLGIGMAVLRIAGGTAAFYASKVQPDVQDPLAPDGDWLAETVTHAHANGIEIHPYVNNCVVEGRTSPESLARLEAEGRLQQDPNGRVINWFCPSQEVNLAAMEAPMLEIVRDYDVDGIQYDFIRYNGTQGCFCEHCRALFEKETETPVADWPKDVIEGDRHDEWVEFRCRRISAIVERISTGIRAIKPEVKISAAVFRDWPTCRENNGQDWVRWCEEGWLDMVCPMNYTLDAAKFAERAAIDREAVPEGFPILQGIGIAAGTGSMRSADELAVQIALARRHGAQGFIGFCYQPEHTVSLFEPLLDWIDRR